MKPLYHITQKILKLVALVSEKIDEVYAAHLNKPPTALRKKNRIKTIHSSLEIFMNGLIKSACRLRSKLVGIVKGTEVAPLSVDKLVVPKYPTFHMAKPSDRCNFKIRLPIHQLNERKLCLV